MNRHAETAAIAAGLMGVAYATPARLRPALAVGATVVLSRLHGRENARLAQEFHQLFDQRNAVRTELDALKRNVIGESRRLDVIERVITQMYGGRDLFTIVRGTDHASVTDRRDRLVVFHSNRDDR